MVRQKEYATILFENYSKAIELSNSAMNSSGNAMKRMEIREDGIEAVTADLERTFQNFAKNTLDSTVVKSILKSSNALLGLVDSLHLVQIALVVLATVGMAKLIKLFPTLIANVGNAIIANAAYIQSKQANATMTSIESMQLRVLNSQQIANMATTGTLAGLVKGLNQAQTEEILVLAGVTPAVAKDSAVKIANATATGAATIATDGLTGAIWTNIKAMIAWMYTNPVGWILGIVTIVGLAVAAYKAWGDTLENSRKKLEESKKEYQEIQSTLQGLNNELKTTQDRINELQSKDSLTLVEATELEQLKKTNAELQRKIDLQETYEKTKNEETTKDFVDFMEKDRSTTKNRQLVSSNGNWYDDLTTRVTTEKFLGFNFTALDKAYKNLADPKISDKQKEKIQKNIDKIEKELTDKSEEYQKQAEGISYIPNPTTDQEKASNAQLDYIKNFQSKVLKALNPEAVAKEMQGILDEPDFKGLEDKLRGLAKDGKITAEQLKGDEFKGFREALEAAGYDVEDFVEIFNKTKTSAKDNTEAIVTVADALDDLETKASTLVDSYDLLKKVQDEFKENGKLSLETIKQISEAYPSLKGSVAEYLAGLKTEKQLLKELSGAYQVDVDNYNSSIIAKLSTSTEFYNNLSTDQKKIIDNLAKSYNVDLTNVKTIEQLKEKVRNQYMTTWMRNYNKYVDLSLNEAKQLLHEYTLRNNVNGGAYKQEISDLNAYISAIQNVNTALDNTVFKGTTFTPEKFTTDKESLQDKADKARQVNIDNFEKEKAELDHLRALDQINAQEYYKRLAALDKTYYGTNKEYTEEHKKNLEELWDLQKEILEDQKSMYEQALDYVNKVIDKQITALEKQKEALQKKNDEEDRAIELQKLQENLEKAKTQRNMRVYYEDKGWVNLCPII